MILERYEKIGKDMSDKNRIDLRKELLRKQKEEIELHDNYILNPEINLPWYRKYTSKEFVAFLLSLLFMSTVATVLIYLFKQGYFQPQLVDQKVIQVEVQKIVLRGDTYLSVIHEPSVTATNKKLNSKIQNSLLGNNISSSTNSGAPNVSVALSNSMVVHLEPLARPFDIQISNWTHKCKSISVKDGDKIDVYQSTFYRLYDKTYFYEFSPVIPVCKQKKWISII